MDRAFKLLKPKEVVWFTLNSGQLKFFGFKIPLYGLSHCACNLLKPKEIVWFALNSDQLKSSGFKIPLYNLPHCAFKLFKHKEVVWFALNSGKTKALCLENSSLKKSFKGLKTDC